jgi:putative chitinase
MPGRANPLNMVDADGHRYGFQGQELDDEIKGLRGASVNYKYRMHDPRVGRFFAVDPLANDYPEWTPYQFSGNQVIQMVELEGLEPAKSGSNSGEGAVAPKRDDNNNAIKGTEGTKWVWGIENNNKWNEVSFNVTKTEMKSIFPTGNSGAMEVLEQYINLHGDKFGIENKKSLAHFLSQAGHEVGDFSKGLTRTENLNYSAKGLLGTFPKYFTSSTANKFGRTSEHAANQEGIANTAYANRLGNGDFNSGDGWKYRGRGIFQLTGKSNYKAFGIYLNENTMTQVDIVQHSQLVSQSKSIAILSAMWYFKTRVADITNLNSSSVERVTKLVNGGVNGLSDRKNIYNRAVEHLND